jgi:hypothetical protein
VACRTSREKRELLRVVRVAGGEIRLDPTGRLNGRGAYVDPDPACIDQAIDRGLLARALEAPVPAELRWQLMAAAGTTQTDAVTAGGAHGQE